MIHAMDVSMTYPGEIVVLRNINFKISPGEFVFIHGTSGTGRTTLLRILIGAEKPTRGEVVINGMKITEKGFNKIHELRKTLGIISQDFKLLRDRTVSENVAFPLEVAGHGRKEVQKRVSRVLVEVGIEDREGHPIHLLSAGEQQRVGIARAIIHDPDLLLADEPTGNLDAQRADDMMRIFTSLHEKRTTIVFATRNKEIIEHYPHRVISIPGESGIDGSRVDTTRSETQR